MTRENIRDWFQLDEGDTGFQLLTKEQLATVALYSSVLSPLLYIFHLFFDFFLTLRAASYFINPHYRLIMATCAQIHPD
jgi:hypothetical protein